MADINWQSYNIPDYDLSDLRKSKELAYNTQADVADKIEKSIRERKQRTEDFIMKLLGMAGGGAGGAVGGIGSALK